MVTIKIELKGLIDDEWYSEFLQAEGIESAYVLEKYFIYLCSKSRLVFIFNTDENKYLNFRHILGLWRPPIYFKLAQSGIGKGLNSERKRKIQAPEIIWYVLLN